MTLTALRPFTLPKDLRPCMSIGERPKIAWLPLSLLLINDAYQRPVTGAGRRNVVAILECFDWRKFAPLIVAPTADDRYEIIDGQHRATAALMHPLIDHVPCYVIDADQKMAAQCFAAINGQVTALTGGQLFHARVAAGEDLARRVKAVCDDVGVTLLRYKFADYQLKPGDTQSVGTVEKIYVRSGEAVARRTLAALMAVAPSTVNLTLTPLRAMAAAAVARPDADLVAVFSGVRLEPRLAAAKMKAAESRGPAVPIMTARLVDDIDRRTARAAKQTEAIA